MTQLECYYVYERMEIADEYSWEPETDRVQYPRNYVNGCGQKKDYYLLRGSYEGLFFIFKGNKILLTN